MSERDIWTGDTWRLYHDSSKMFCYRLWTDVSMTDGLLCLMRDDMKELRDALNKELEEATP